MDRFRIEILNESEKLHNEDVAGFSRTGFWVLDGASALMESRLTTHDSDVRWYVEFWDAFLRANLDRDEPIKAILKEGIRKLQGFSYNETATKLNFPSAAIGIVRRCKDGWEYFLLGDCTVSFLTQEGVQTFKDERVCRLDDQVLTMVSQKRGQWTPEALEMLQKNRSLKNTEEGYWILEKDESAIDRGLYGQVKFAERVLLTTDGFSCGFEQYQIFELEQLLKGKIEQGLKSCYEAIRGIERKDRQRLKHPRMKVHDDSSAVLIALE